MRDGTAAKFRVCPKQYASSCLRRADGEENAAAMASIAGIVCGVDGDWDAKCLRLKRARKRAASGDDSDTSVLRRVRTVVSQSTTGADSTAEGAMLWL